MIQNPSPPRAGRREWIGLSVLALACLMYVMDLTVLHLAVPSLSADLKPSSGPIALPAEKAEIQTAIARERWPGS